MTVRYRLDPTHSQFTVQAFASGMLSFLGHNPTFAVRDYQGEIGFDPAEAAGASLRITVQAASLQLVDNVSAGDRRQIEDTMRGETLETTAFPQIVFESSEVAAGPAKGDERPVRVTGRMTLHGVTQSLSVDAVLTLYSDGVRLAGEFLLRQSDFRLRPVVALGGTLRLKDPLRVSFNLVGWKQSA